jgi:uncharacterized protein YggE
MLALSSRGLSIDEGASPMGRLIPLIAFLMSAAAVPAFAQDRPADAVVMTLAADGWVKTKTARVTAVADVAIAAEKRASVRERMLDALKKLAPDAEWRISRFDRTQDAAGLERWRAVAEARLPEAALGGLDERARDLSQPGMQVRVQAVQFVPTLAEREAAVGSLRLSIYDQAKAEAARLAKLWPERGYRVARVDFIENGGPPRPMPYMAKQEARAGAADAGDGDSGLAVAQNIAVRAQVTFAPSK